MEPLAGRALPCIGLFLGEGSNMLCQLIGSIYWAHRRKGTSWLSCPGAGSWELRVKCLSPEQGPAWDQEAPHPRGLVLEEEAEGSGFQAMDQQGLLRRGWYGVRGAAPEGQEGSLEALDTPAKDGESGDCHQRGPGGGGCSPGGQGLCVSLQPGEFL